MHAVFEDVIARISRDWNGLSQETAQLRPSEKAHGRSLQKAVEDLVQGYRLTAENLELHLKQGRVTRSQDRSRLQWILQIMILSFGYVPDGAELRKEADAESVRFAPMNGSDLVGLLREELDAMDKLLGRCRAKFGMERVAVHPLLGPLRVDQWRRLHAVYTLHCLKQLRWAQQLDPNATHSVKLAKELQVPAQRSLT